MPGVPATVNVHLVVPVGGAVGDPVQRPGAGVEIDLQGEPVAVRPYLQRRDPIAADPCSAGWGTPSAETAFEHTSDVVGVARQMSGYVRPAPAGKRVGACQESSSSTIV